MAVPFDLSTFSYTSCQSSQCFATFRDIITAPGLAVPAALKKPPDVPAYRVWAESAATASARTSRFARPSLNGAQVAPPSGLLNTPLPRDPAYRTLGLPGSITIALMLVPVASRLSKPLLMDDQ